MRDRSVGDDFLQMKKTIQMKLRGEKPMPATAGLSRAAVLVMLKRPTPYVVDATGFWLERWRAHDKRAA
jgi:hypothetical protein